MRTDGLAAAAVRQGVVPRGRHGSAGVLVQRELEYRGSGIRERIEHGAVLVAATGREGLSHESRSGREDRAALVMATCGCVSPCSLSGVGWFLPRV